MRKELILTCFAILSVQAAGTKLENKGKSLFMHSVVQLVFTKRNDIALVTGHLNQ